jgi:hypothetical protein
MDPESAIVEPVRRHGRHRVPKEPLPPTGKPRYRFVVAIFGIVALAFLTMVTVAAIFPEDGPSAATTPTENPFPPLPDGTPAPGPIPAEGPDGAPATDAPAPGNPTGRPAGRPPTTNAPPAAPTGRVSASYALLPEGVWAAGFQAEVVITNPTGKSQEWQVQLRFPSTVTRYVASWIDGYPEPAVDVSGRTVTFTGQVAVPAKETARLRFQFDKEPDGDFGPVECSVNGRNCSVS